jgi:hypothetical protein
MSFYWNAHDGVVLWLKGRLDEAPSVHLEFEGSVDTWKVVVARQEPHYDGRHASLEASVAAGLLRNLELGHALTIVVSFDNGASLRYRVPASGAQIGVPMYRACIKSVTEHPPSYLFPPARPFLGSYLASERCEFGQIIELHHIPLFVALSEDAHGGRMFFQRVLESENFEGPHWTRKPPDRIEAQALFGQSFDLVEEYRYQISIDQLNELAADLARGATRRFGLTTRQGERSTLKFGGPLGMPFAAMFAACRQAKLSSREPKSHEE